MRGERQSILFPFTCLFTLTHFFAQACTAVAFRTFAMREGLRRAIAATPLHMSITEWPAWTAEVLTYMAVLGQGLRTPDPERTDRASCSRLAAVLLHKDALAAAVASEGLHSCESRASIPKSAVLLPPAVAAHVVLSFY